MNPLTVKNKHDVDYFIVGSRKKVDRTGSAKITQEMHNDCNDIFKELGASKAHWLTG